MSSTSRESARPQSKEPAKGGTESANPKTHPSADSPKPHGDPLKHIVEEQKAPTR